VSHATNINSDIQKIRLHNLFGYVAHILRLCKNSLVLDMTTCFLLLNFRSRYRLLNNYSKVWNFSNVCRLLIDRKISTIHQYCLYRYRLYWWQLYWFPSCFRPLAVFRAFIIFIHYWFPSCFRPLAVFRAFIIFIQNRSFLPGGHLLQIYVTSAIRETESCFLCNTAVKIVCF
jgi:hypothetical protein